jgi:protoporphyrinogen oxidase
VGHLDRVGAVERLGRLPGLALAGSGYRGSHADCVRSGETAARALGLDPA